MLDQFFVYMDMFKQDRLIRVYLPVHYYESEEKYPVLYMHDGQNVFNDQEAIGEASLRLENYLDENELQVIVVAIDQNPEERINEYCPWENGDYSKKVLGESGTSGGKGGEYVDFIVDELKPFIDRKYRTLSEDTAMAGISLGGLITVYAMCRYPEVFKHIAVFSSAFYRNQEEIEKMIREADLSSVISIYLDCGEKESANETVNGYFLASNMSVFDLLKSKAANTEFTIIKDAEHHYSFFRKRVRHIFSFL